MSWLHLLDDFEDFHIGDLLPQAHAEPYESTGQQPDQRADLRAAERTAREQGFKLRPAAPAKDVPDSEGLNRRAPREDRSR